MIESPVHPKSANLVRSFLNSLANFRVQTIGDVNN
jgi:hypothetical protein